MATGRVELCHLCGSDCPDDIMVEVDCLWYCEDCAADVREGMVVAEYYIREVCSGWMDGKRLR